MEAKGSNFVFPSRKMRGRSEHLERLWHLNDDELSNNKPLKEQFEHMVSGKGAESQQSQPGSPLNMYVSGIS